MRWVTPAALGDRAADRPAARLWPGAGHGAGLRRAARRRSSPRSRSARSAASRCRPSGICIALSLRFHLDRQTGGLSRAIERGAKGIEFLLPFVLFNVLPTLLEIALVCGILWRLYDWRFAAVTFVTIAGYIWLHLRASPNGASSIRRADERERQRGQHQGGRQPAELRDGEIFRQRGARGAPLRRGAAALREGGGARRGISLSLLNIGQASIIAVGVTVHDGDGRRGRGRRPHDGRRFRAGQRLSASSSICRSISSAPSIARSASR